MTDYKDPYSNLIILGGGSAGWLAAGIIASQLPKKTCRSFQVTLIESPDVNILGVGEGTWPSMRHTLQLIGIDEQTFLAHCQGAFKQGSKFVNWGAEGVGDTYFHPFTNPVGQGELDMVRFGRTALSGTAFADVVDCQSRLIDAGLAPKQLKTPNYAGVCNYGYHFDAGALTELLKSHCINHLGVRYVRDHVDEVVATRDNFLQGLQCRRSGLVTGDFFIDCSGAGAKLVAQHYKSEWCDVSHILFNDRAIAVQVPYANDDNALMSATVATGQTFGWTWDINLQQRRGVGHVYSSHFGDEASIEAALESYIRQRLPGFDLHASATRTLRFQPGYRPKPWQNNCVAIGMAAGFVEPLEASALAMTELALTMLVDQFPRNQTQLNYCQQQFNQRFAYRWQRVVDFLKLHYALSTRDDSEYWLAHRQPDSLSERLAELLEHWRYTVPSRFDLPENEEVFSSASYQYVLYGMRPNYTRFDGSQSDAEARQCQQAQQMVEKRFQQCRAGLPMHREWLDQVLSVAQAKAG